MFFGWTRRTPRRSRPSQRAAVRWGRHRLPLRLEALEDRTVPTTFVVTNSNDSGVGSFRQAILDSNGTAGPNNIVFAVTPTGEPIDIAPLTALPTITDSVIIDGYTQSSAGPNTLSFGNDASIQIVVDGGYLAGAVAGLDIAADGVVIKGLGVINCPSDAIRIVGNNNYVVGCYIGVDPTAPVTAPNGGAGVFIGAGSSGNVIGGANPYEQNIVVANGTGIILYGAGNTNNTIQGNYVGLGQDGSTVLANAGDGIDELNGAGGNIIGGPLGAGNIIVGHTAYAGIKLAGAGGTSVWGNTIGIAGGVPLGNGIGIVIASMNNLIGGLNAANAPNAIAFNGKGVVVVGAAGTGNTISGNNIFGNAGPGIDLGDDGVTPNGAAGPMNYPAFPVITDVTGSTITGFLTATPGDYRIELFASPQSGPSRQGLVYLDKIAITVPASGVGYFNLSIPTGIPLNFVVTATATNLTTGETSEFSAGPPVNLQSVTGSDQATTVNTSFGSPLSFQVVDAYGEAVQGLTVKFDAPASGASAIFANSGVAQTQASGTVMAPSTTANTIAGGYLVNASIAGTALGTTFTLENLPGPASSLAFTGLPEKISAGTGFVLYVEAVDAYGNVQTSISDTVRLQANDPTALLPSEVALSAESSAFTVLFPRSGNKTITAINTGRTTLMGSVSFTVDAILFPEGMLLLPVLNTPYSGLVATFTTSYPAVPDEFIVTINWGDDTSSPGEVRFNAAHTGFEVYGTHTFTSETTYLVDVMVDDPMRQTQENTAPSAAAVLTSNQGSQITDADYLRGGADVLTGTVSATHVSATVLRTNPSPTEDFTLFVATYASNPESVAIDGLEYHDVRATGLGENDRLTVQFEVSVSPNQQVALYFFDRSTGAYRLVQSSQSVALSRTDDPNSGRATITVTFDQTSFPTLMQLGGTVFTITLAPTTSGTSSGGSTTTTFTTTIDPTLASGLTTTSSQSTTDSTSNSQTVTFQTSSQLSTTVISAQDSRGIAANNGGGEETENKDKLADPNLPEFFRDAMKGLLKFIRQTVMPGIIASPPATGGVRREEAIDAIFGGAVALLSDATPDDAPLLTPVESALNESLSHETSFAAAWIPAVLIGGLIASPTRADERRKSEWLSQAQPRHQVDA